MKLYIVSNTVSGTENIKGIYYLVTEDGELLGSKFCSNRAWAKNDLYYRNNKIKKLCREKYEDIHIVILGKDDMTIDKLKLLNMNFINSDN